MPTPHSPHARRRRIRLVLVAAATATLVVAAISATRVFGAGALPESVIGVVGDALGGDLSAGPGAGQGADGAIDDAFGISPFDDEHPAIARLAPALRTALQQAAADAAHDGIEMRLTSGWRSEAYQQRLFDDAVGQYGSEAEARRYVKPAGESSHNTGDAIDVGMTDASYWMMSNGSRYGLCQTYANEIWHYELTVAPGDTCPPPVPDATG